MKEFILAAKVKGIMLLERGKEKIDKFIKDEEGMVGIEKLIVFAIGIIILIIIFKPMLTKIWNDFDTKQDTWWQTKLNQIFS